MNKIDRFEKEYYFLSNFYPCEIVYRGITYHNTEAAFQAQKCATDSAKMKYSREVSPSKAKAMGRNEGSLPKNWDEMSIIYMEEIVREKFKNKDFAEKLLATGDAYIEEGNYWHDNRWGNCSCERCANIEGKNLLGKILMKIRDELKNA